METSLIDLPAWETPFPSPMTLRAEVNGMVSAIRDVLVEFFSAEEIEGIYFIGSAQKPWDTPIDYVPEMSDTDIHVWFTEYALIDTRRFGIERSRAFQAEIEARFFSLHPHALHVPRPQIVVLNERLCAPDFHTIPVDAVNVLYGAPYPGSDADDPERIRTIECERMIGEQEYLARLPFKIIDRPGHYLWEVLRSLAWHISPVGPRVLAFAGIRPEEAWSMNRTRVVTALEACGETEFARTYATYYIAAWQYHFSGCTYSAAAREAVQAGVDVLQRGIEFANAWKASVD